MIGSAWPAGSRRRVFSCMDTERGWPTSGAPSEEREAALSLTAAAFAIADPLRYDGFFRRYLSNATLINLCISAVILHIDLGLDRYTTFTGSLENITTICLPNVFGFAGSKVGRCEFRFQRGGWIDTASHFSVD